MIAVFVVKNVKYQLVRKHFYKKIIISIVLNVIRMYLQLDVLNVVRYVFKLYMKYNNI